MTTAVSLVPSATDTAVALGAGDSIVGLSADCDQPDPSRPRPVVTRPVIDPSRAAEDPAAVDTAVRDLVESGRPLYELDVELVRELAPEVIFAQDSCSVCALPSSEVARVLRGLGVGCDVVSLDPDDLEAVLESFATVGAALGRPEAGLVLAADARARLARLARAAAAPRRVLVLDWVDPPYVAGNWVPDLVRMAGAEPVLAEAGPSRQVGADEVAASGAEVVVVAPCGLGLPVAVDAARRFAELFKGSGVLAADGRVFFSRPGPRLVDGAEVLAGWLGGGQPPAGSGFVEVRAA